MRARLASHWLRRAGLAAVVMLTGCGSVQAPGAAGGGTAAGGTGTGSSGTGGGSGTGTGNGTGSAGAGGGTGPSSSASASQSGPAAVACTASGLRVRLNTAVAGVAAGSYYVPLEFTNTSGRPCQLDGYPAVAFASSAAGHQIGAEAAVDKTVRVSPVLLVPGGMAHAWLQVLNAASYPASMCHPVKAGGLRVVAPGTEDSSYVPHPVSACKGALRGSQILTVHPVQQGPARRGTA